MTVVRFCDRLGIPTATWYYWRASFLAGRPVRRWPTPVLDAVDEAVAETAHKYSAWGHRKIWAMIRADGFEVSQSSVRRTMARRGLLQPRRYQAEVRALAKARKSVFTNPPTRRNRVWQSDFSEFETAHGGFWQLSGYVDYAAKLCLTAQADGAKTRHEALLSLKAALAAAEALLGHSLQEDCTNPETGEITPLVIVTDNGSCYKSAEFAAFIEARKPWLYHVRTRFRAPWTNGVIERFFQSLKYEHLYRQEITNGLQLGDEIATFVTLYNEIRPHEHLNWQVPLAGYVAAPAPDDPDQPPKLPGSGPPFTYNPEPPRPRTRRPPGPPRPSR